MIRNMGPFYDRNLPLSDQCIRLNMFPLSRTRLNEQEVRRVRFYRSRYDNKPSYLSFE